MPGRGGSSIPLLKIGLTGGATASLMSRLTDQLATRLLDQNTLGVVSDEYGSGGSKRQRRIEAAVLELGIVRETIHPIIRRPYYALNLVENLPEVVLCNAKPNYLIDSRENCSDYCRQAVAAWRDRWLKSAQRRLQKNGEVV